MKIALLAHPLYPIAEPFAGGLEMIIHSLAKSLQEKGHEVHLYAHPDSDEAFNLHPVIVDDLELKNKHGLKETDGVHHLSTIAFAKAIHHISRSDYDLVHSHILNGMVLQQMDSLEIPVIHTFHTPKLPALLTGVLTLAEDAGITFTAVSQHLADCWADHCPSRINVVYNGIDIDRWSATRQKEDYLFWCGRICKEKAPHHALQAAIHDGRKIKFAGPVHDYDFFRKQVEPYCQNPLVTYLGHLSQDKLSEHLQKANLLLFTSLWDEPYGLVLAESLACGTPVVAYDSGAVKEILTPSCSVIVKKGNLWELENAISKGLALESSESRKRAEDFCNQTTMVDGYIELYGSVLDQQKHTLEVAI